MRKGFSITSLLCILAGLVLLCCQLPTEEETAQFVLSCDGVVIPNDTGNYAISGAVGGSFSDTVFTIENQGIGDLLLTGNPTIEIAGYYSPMFFPVPPYPSLRIAPSERTTLTIRFSPPAGEFEGKKDVALRIATNDPDTSLYDIGIHAFAGAAPEMDIYNDSSLIECNTGSFAFPCTLVGYSHETIFTIKNVGTQSLILTGNPDLITISGPDADDFDLLDETSQLISHGNSDTFTIRFAPTAGGSKSATVTIPNDDDNENPYTFTITGSGRESGSLDSSFGTGGLVETDLGGSESCSALALRPDGKILAVGATHTASYNYFALVQYANDGILDPDFGSGGVVTEPTGSLPDMILMPDGRALVVGGYHTGSGYDIQLARYLEGGGLDPTFGDSGVVTEPITGFLWYVGLQSAGKIVVGGTVGNDFAVARFLADGTLDTSFGSDGLVRSDFGGTEQCYNIAVQPDDKIVLVGQRGAFDFALVRYDSDGSIDTGFGSNGIVTTDFSYGSSDLARAVHLLPDGRMLVAGGSNGDFALARYLPNGSLDPSFGHDGKVTTDIGDRTPDSALSIALQSNGKILVGGASKPENGYYDDFALVRYHADGTLDTTFGNNGRVFTPVGSSSDAGIATLVVQPDGKILAGGGPHYAFVIARYKP